MSEHGRRVALSLVIPVAAVLAAGAGLVAAISGSELASEIIVPVSLLTLLGGIFVLLRSLERLRGEAEARAQGETEERTRRILDRSHEAYIAIDDDGVVTAWNAAAETMFGWRRMEAVGRPVADLIVPVDQRQLHRDGLVRYQETGHGPMLQGRSEVIAIHRDGAELPVELSIIAIDDEGGKSFHGFVRDITERKLLETQQAEMLEAAKESARIDALTTLPNRRGWDEALSRELARARREQIAVLHRAPGPRSLQGVQRHPRPPGGRPPAAPRRLGLEAGAAPVGPGRALRRRGVRGAAPHLRAR